MRSGRAERNPAEYLKEVLEPQEKGRFAALGADGLPALVRAMYANEACMSMPTRITMRLMLLVFVRTSELIETPVERNRSRKRRMDHPLAANEAWQAPYQPRQDKPPRLLATPRAGTAASAARAYWR